MIDNHKYHHAFPKLAWFCHDLHILEWPKVLKKWIKIIASIEKLIICTPKANFSKKCETPLGYATSYLDPESITTVQKHLLISNYFIQQGLASNINCTSNGWKLSISVFWCNSKTIFQNGYFGFMITGSNSSENWFRESRQWLWKRSWFGSWRNIGAHTCRKQSVESFKRLATPIK